MLQQRIERRWLEAFTRVFALCEVSAGDTVAILSESQSRPVNVELAELALLERGAQVFQIRLPTPALSAPVPVRSTGASDVLQGIAAVVTALGSCDLVVDCTVEGLLHAAELPSILALGARVLMVSNEHPEILERLQPDTALETKVKHGIRCLRAARHMQVSSDAGTALEIDVEQAPAGGGWGYTRRPGTVTHWPGGLCLCFPAAGTVNGTLVMSPGDVNLTFKRYLETEIRLRIEADYVVAVEGSGLDAELMRSYFAAWNDREAYAVSHVGWGMNPIARWDALTMYDRNDVNGTELRAYAGNFLYSTGANETAGRHTQAHFDLPLRNCSITLDDELIVRAGILLGELA